jgi:aldose 1-epimerase
LIEERTFGTLKSGTPVSEYTLTNSSGMRVKVLTFGGIVRTIEVPDRSGKTADVVLGFDSLASYEERHPYLGTITGRVANRIAKGHFSLDGKTYSLAINNGPNHLHGGVVGFDRAVWKASTTVTDRAATLTLSHTSPDMDEGYPGELSISVDYSLTNSNELWIRYRATTNKATPINLTNHSYFNLSGEGHGDILSHTLEINADKIVPVDETSIPTGTLMNVQGTPFDFRQPHAIGERISQVGIGYDHTYVLSSTSRDPELAATLSDPSTGRVLTVLTTEPGVQLYTGNYLNGSLTGKSGSRYGKHAGVCLETQHFPDSVNQPSFPTTILRPGEEYTQTTVLRFGINS